MNDRKELNSMLLPVIPLRNMCFMPDSIIHFDLSRKKSILALEKAMSEKQLIFLTAQKNGEEKEPAYEGLYSIGTYARIKQIIKMPNKIVRVMAEGIQRARLLSFSSEESFMGEICILESDEERENWLDDITQEAMKREICERFIAYADIVNKTDQGMMQHLKDISSLARLLDHVMTLLPVGYEQKQKVLETLEIEERYHCVTDILQRETGIAQVRKELAEGVKSRIDENQRDYILKEQLNYIREELGENSLSEAERFREKLDKIEASKEVKSRIKKEINRYEHMSQSSAESVVQRNYLETLLELPWDKRTEDTIDLSEAEKILEADHYGLPHVKERILEYLAVRQLKGGAPSQIICLVGPPGTGKTSIAKSMAKAMNKKYMRICLGGVRDEAEIRGHRRTYVGAMPGRIVTALRQADVKNPLILLDEIDKMSSDYKGATSSAMLEVLDSEQNRQFQDHFIELPVDLSEVVFVATANDLQSIDAPLRDRMEIIEISGYTATEKLHIAKDHLVKKQLKQHGITAKQLSITGKALEKIIACYTREAGVRNLERQIGTICRKCARTILEQKQTKIKVTLHNLDMYLGKEKYTSDYGRKKDEIGVVTGLAWTSVGGTTLEIEVNNLPGRGSIKITGQLGNIMKESAVTALSFVRSISGQYGVDKEYFAQNDLHIHIPEGAVPKDGPSAGITMATAILSAVIGRRVKADLAMTGEITLRGRVLAIGGLKEKLLAAKMAQIHTVLIPEENQKDLCCIDEEIKTGLNIITVSTMKEVLEQALV